MARAEMAYPRMGSRSTYKASPIRKDTKMGGQNSPTATNHLWETQKGRSQIQFIHERNYNPEMAEESILQGLAKPMRAQTSKEMVSKLFTQGKGKDVPVGVSLQRRKTYSPRSHSENHGIVQHRIRIIR